MHPLAQLLKKPAEASIIGYLAVSPLRAHSAQEITKRLKYTPQKGKLALQTLMSEGWLKMNSKQGRDFYTLNLKFKPAAELRQGLVKDKPTPTDDFTKAIKKLGQVKAAFLSGIFTGHPELQADLLLVGKISEIKLKTFLQASEDLLGFEINYTTMSEEEFIERRNMLDRFLRDLFDNPYLTVVDNL